MAGAEGPEFSAFDLSGPPAIRGNPTPIAVPGFRLIALVAPQPGSDLPHSDVDDGVAPGEFVTPDFLWRPGWLIRIEACGQWHGRSSSSYA